MPQLERSPAERRLIKLATWFLMHGPATREEVYEAFAKDYTSDPEAREKNWTRDKKELKRLGVPLRYSEEEGGKYRIEPGSFYLPALSFTPSEAAVLTTAARTALRDGEHPLHDDLEAALRKLIVSATGLPPRAADIERGHHGRMPAKLRKWLDDLEEAVEDEKVLRLRYWVPARDEVTERNLSPYGYAWRRGEWLLVGYCHTRKAIRVFYMRRVRALKALVKPKKDLPDGDPKKYVAPPDDFDIRKWSRQQPWEFFAHEPVEAVLRFKGSLAKIAPKLVPGTRLSTAPDNARVARLVVRNIEGLARQCLAWGPEAEIVSPPEARERARAMLGAIGAGGAA